MDITIKMRYCRIENPREAGNYLTFREDSLGGRWGILFYGYDMSGKSDQAGWWIYQGENGVAEVKNVLTWGNLPQSYITKI